MVASVRGSKYVGEFVNNKATGFGVFFWPNGDRFVGECREDKKEGRGVEYRADGSVIRSGQWAEGTLIRSFDLNAIAFPFAPNFGTVVPTSLSSTTLSDRGGLQPCPEKGVKDNCVGSDNFAGGARYVGEYRAGRRMGEGILYDAQGGVISSGRWQDFALLSSYPIEASLFPFDPNTEILRRNFQASISIGPNALPWKDRLDRVVQSELRHWLSPQNAGLEEVPAPQYPASLSLKQEPWETNKEFEDRVEKARTERRLAIDRLQAEYRAKVEERNKRVAEFNRTRTEREAQLPQKRRELVLLGISILNPSVAIADPALDQQSGALTVSAQVDGLGK